MKIIEYDSKYDENIKELLVELENYIISIDKDELDKLSENYKEEYFKSLLKNIKRKNGKIYLAIKEERAVGVIAGVVAKYSKEDSLDYKCPKKGIIEELVVNKNYQKYGIGQQLLKTMEEYLKNINCEYVCLDVLAYNENAIKFYEKNNYHTRMMHKIKKI